MRSSEELDELYKRDCGVCWICHRVVAREIATRDHLIPRSKGGPDNRRNYAIACEACNNARGSKNMISEKQVREIVSNCQSGKCFACQESKTLVNFSKVSSQIGSRKVLRGFCGNCRIQIPKQFKHDANVTDRIQAQWVKKGQKIRFNIGSIHSGRVVDISQNNDMMFIILEGNKKKFMVPCVIKVELLKNALV